MRPTIKKPIACGAVIGSLLAVLICGVATTALAGARSSSNTVYYRLVQYPKAGFGGFYSQIAAAKHTIDMEMYELSDPTAEHDLAQAAAHGVKVRVLLDRDYSGGEVNASAYSYLSSHGVKVRWAPSHYIFHIKATIFDGRAADISTANLTAAYYTDTRDAEVIDTNPAQIKAIERTFSGDWNDAPGGSPRDETRQAAGLVWSPNTGTGSAEDAVVEQVTAARHVIDVESEELSDRAVYEALAADARRGVNCRIVMTSSSEWRTAYSAVTRAGCKVHVFPDSAKSLYIHEKLILDDPGTSHQSLLIGSQNAGWESLHANRELSVLIGGAHGGAAVIGQVLRTFQSDFSQAPAWKS